jgi:hypothetical protein
MCLSAKDFCNGGPKVVIKIMLMIAAALLASPTLAQPLVDAESERAAAISAEKQGDWNAALLHYENIFDSALTDDATRTNLRAKFIELRPKVAPNTDPDKAGTWKIRAYIFRTLDFSWKDKDGNNHHAFYKFRNDELDAIKVAMDGFSECVWRYSLGNLKIKYDIQVIDKPLTKLDGDYSFWPGPASCMPFFDDLKPGEVDGIFVYAKVHGSKDKGEESEDIPLSLLAGTFGVLSDTKGATYIGFNTGEGMCEDASGEVQWHEWLHSAQWAIEDLQGYPSGLMTSSDNGRNEGESGGDLCFRRKPGEKNWMPFYVHIMEQHGTRKMWRELSIINKPDNPWIDQYCRNFKVCGPFNIKGNRDDLGLNEAFIDEVGAMNGKSSKAGQWKQVSCHGRNLSFSDAFGQKENCIGYALVNVKSDKDQPAQLRLGTDDACKLWHNGQVILYAPVLRGLTVDQNIVDVQLKQGNNTFLLKVMNGEGDWGAIFRITDFRGNPVNGVTYLP